MKRLLSSALLIGALAAAPASADEVVACAAGAWFAADARAVKDTTWDGAPIVGGETTLALRCSPNAWGENPGGTNAAITWASSTGSGGTVAAAATATSLSWIPEARFATNTLSYVSGSVAKTSTVWVVCLHPAAPVVEPVSGTAFDTFLTVNMSCASVDATIHYTTNGTTPTPVSPAYERFVIWDSATVKAIAVFPNGGTSEVTTVEYVKRDVATPVISVPKSFSGTKTMVSVACATEDAVVRYTTDGTVPDLQSAVYAGPFAVTATCTIQARAFKTDDRVSDVATSVVTKVWGICDALNDPDRTFMTDATSGWVRDTEVSRDGVESMRSGALAASTKSDVFNASSMSTVVNGRGTVRFWWKASCENDDVWDHGEFTTDGQTWTIHGETDWQEVSHVFATDGAHTLVWKYLKDNFGSQGRDCVWVDMFHWTPESTASTDVPVPGAWIDLYYPGTLDYEARAKQLAANGVNTVEEAYVAGLDPTNAASVFTTTVSCSNGMVYVGWTPNLNQGVVARVYRICGRTDLQTGDWESPLQAWHRFFKVVVTMPTGQSGETTDVSDEGFVPGQMP